MNRSGSGRIDSFPLSRRVLISASVALAFGRDGFAQDTVNRLVGALASALSSGDATLFLKHFDASMPDFAKLRQLVSALVNQAEVGSSIDLLGDEGDGQRRSLELDWLLEITGKQADAPSMRRRATVKCTVARRGREWIVTAFEPVDFFAPPSAPER